MKATIDDIFDEKSPPDCNFVWRQIGSDNGLLPIRRQDIPDSKVHGANMGPPGNYRTHAGGPHVGPMDLAIWDYLDPCWLIVNWALKNILQRNFNLNTIICFNEIHLNICKKSANLILCSEFQYLDNLCHFLFQCSFALWLPLSILRSWDIDTQIVIKIQKDYIGISKILKYIRYVSYIPFKAQHVSLPRKLWTNVNTKMTIS